VRLSKVGQTRFGGYVRWGTRPGNDLITVKFNIEIAIRNITIIRIPEQVPAPKTQRPSLDMERLRTTVEALQNRLNVPLPQERAPSSNRQKINLERITVTVMALMTQLTTPRAQGITRKKPTVMIETTGTLVKKMAFYEPTLQKTSDGHRTVKSFDAETTSVQDGAFANDPIKNLSAMGYMWSENDLNSHRLKQKILQKIGSKFGKISKYTGQGIKWVARGAFTALSEGFDNVNDLMDVYGVLQLFTDGMNYDPAQIENDAVMYLDADQLQNAALSVMTQQLQVMKTYNSTKVDLYNKDISNALEPDWPKPRQKFPLIIGPLEQLDVEDSGGEVWRVQARLQFEIDTVMDTLLRDTSRSYTIAFASLLLNSAGYDYNELLLYPSPSLVYFMVDNDSGTYNFRNDASAEYDQLLREAYTIVCRSHGGVVYEDLHPLDTSDWIPSSLRGQRPRFQCSWTKTDCQAFTRNWLTKSSDPSAWTPGIFGEWFKFDEIDDDTLPPSDRADLEQSSGQSGACMASTFTLGQTCSYYKGTYDYENRKCIFSEQYCQALGTCFNKTTQTCYLPPDAMQAASIFFGEGGPRAWIRANGCNFTSDIDNFETALNLTGVGMLFTPSGQRMFSDALANRRNWSQGFRTILSDPTYTMNFISSVIGIAAAATGAGFFSPVGLLAFATGIVGGLMAGFDAMKASWVEKTAPPTDAREYSVGGLIRDRQGVQQPNRLAFTDGWVTKPMKLHAFGDITKHIRVQDYPYTKIIPFFPDYHDPVLDVLSWLNLQPNPTKNLCFDEPGGMVRAGSDGDHNKVWCFPYKPDVNGFFDRRIGLPAEETFDRGNPYLTNASWNGRDHPNEIDYPWGPNGPGARDGPAFKGGDTSNEHWYYQLVYERTSIEPTIIWNTAYLLQYFTEQTISDMRREYCIDRLAEIEDTTKPVPDLCWGYVNVKTSKYLFMPMTVLKYVSSQVLS
jgi:hypothetical protein